MYADPRHIRNNEVKLRFNDREAKLIEAVANFSGQQRAVLLRELVMEGLQILKAEQPDLLTQNQNHLGRP